MSQHAKCEAAARAFDANPCRDTADAINSACYGTEDWWTPQGTPTRNGFRCVALWVAHVRALDAEDQPAPADGATCIYCGYQGEHDDHCYGRRGGGSR